MKRKLFCEISPLTYSISAFKCRMIRRLNNLKIINRIAKSKSQSTLPIVVYSHKSLIRRKLGNVDMQLQENKAVNLQLSAPKVNGIIIKPKEIFSFWALVGSISKRKGYREGLTINNEKSQSGIGGGMCQFTNLIHWLILHSPLEIIEHHHHNGIDLFPDFNRQVPFGVGTSIVHNYLDYRFVNNTDTPFQLIVYTTEGYLCGELLSNKALDIKYHIYVEDEYFHCIDNDYYRHNKIHRKYIDKKTGNTVKDELLIENNSKVMYDIRFINQDRIRL